VKKEKKRSLFDATCAFSSFFFEIINEKRREKRINDHHGSPPRGGAEKRKTKKTETTVRERDFRLLLRFRLRVVLVHERNGKFAKLFLIIRRVVVVFFFRRVAKSSQSCGLYRSLRAWGSLSGCEG